MYDIVHEVMLATGDPDLGAFDAVGSIVCGGRPRADHAQVSAALGLCQTHGAGPFAADEFVQVGCL